MKLKPVVLLITGAIVLIFANCPTGTITGLQPPASVDVNKDAFGNHLIVEWESAGSGLAYDVYRVVDGTATLIPGSRTTALDFFDLSYPVKKNIQYRVRSVNANDLSGLSVPTRSVNVPLTDLLIENLSATRLELAGGILVTWDHLVQGGVNPSYTLKRYKSKAGYTENSEIGADAVIATPTINPNGTVTYWDTTAAVNTPYYYLVDWVDLDDGTNGIDSEFAFGIYGDKDDHQYEKNDDWNLLPSFSTAFPAGTRLQTYSFEDNGVTDKDIDWYVYRGVPRNITITLKNAPDLVGKIKVDFFYANTVIAGGVYLYNGQTFDFTQDFFTDPYSSTPDTVYFRIYPDSPGSSFIGTYEITTNY